MNKHKVTTFEPAYSSSGWWVAEVCPWHGTTPAWTGTECPSVAEHTHTCPHSDGDHADSPVHLMCASWGCRRKPEYPEKIHTELGGRANSAQTVAPAGDPLPTLPFINSKIKLFEDLLYFYFLSFFESSSKVNIFL